MAIHAFITGKLDHKRTGTTKNGKEYVGATIKWRDGFSDFDQRADVISFGAVASQLDDISEGATVLVTGSVYAKKSERDGKTYANLNGTINSVEVLAAAGSSNDAAGADDEPDWDD